MLSSPTDHIPNSPFKTNIEYKTNLIKLIIILNTNKSNEGLNQHTNTHTIRDRPQSQIQWPSYA